MHPDFQVYTFKAKVWVFDGPGGWHFVTINKKISEEIYVMHKVIAKNWGSIPVQCQIGKTIWNTSIFRDTKSNAYLLPLRADIRKKEKIIAGKTVQVQLLIC